MARTVRKSGMKEVPLSEIKDDLSRFLREAEKPGDCHHAPRQTGGTADRLRVRRRTGLNTGSRMIRDSYVVSSRLDTACKQDAGSV